MRFLRAPQWKQGHHSSLLSSFSSLHKCSEDKYYSKYVECRFLVSHSTPSVAQMVKTFLSPSQCPPRPHTNIPTSAKGSAMVQRAAYSLKPLRPSVSLTNYYWTAYCPALRIPFSPPLRTMTEQCTGSTVANLATTQVCHWSLPDSYDSAIFHGFPSLINPPNLISIALGNRFPYCITCPYHIVSDFGQMRKGWWGGRRLVWG